MRTVRLTLLLLFIACAAAPAASLLTNAGFETGDGGSPADPSGWTEFGPDTTGERSSAYARSGSFSAKRWTGGDFQEYGYYQNFAASPGKEYSGSAYLFSPANDALSGSSYACIRLEFYSSANQRLLRNESARLRAPNAAFLPYTVAAIAPAGTSYGRFVCAVGGLAAPHLGAAYCDDASVEEADVQALGDDEFLDLLQRRIFDFFWNESSASGLIKDRANNFGADPYFHSSIASVGFGLAVICIAEERGWISRQEAYDRVETTLVTFRDDIVNTSGFFHHFVNMNTLAPMPGSEVSTIDTALLLFGALMAGEYFAERYGDPSLKMIADGIYERVNWPALYTGWSTYSEYIMMDLLAMGSPTHPSPASIWQIVNRRYEDSIATRPSDHSYPRFFYPALFTHQYPHCYIDFRFRHDAYTPAWTYFDSSTQNTLTNRQYCIDHSVTQGIAQPKYQSYGPDAWGLTAGDGPDGYEAFGEADPDLPEPQGTQGMDGTVLPHGPGGSVMFVPDLCISALRGMLEDHGPRIWGRYGFSDSYNVDRNWWASDVIGIDLGAMFLSVENYRTGRPWRYFMHSKGIRRGLQVAGFAHQPRPSWDDFNSGLPNAWGSSCQVTRGSGSISYEQTPWVNAWVNGNAVRIGVSAEGGGAAVCLNSLDLTYEDEIRFWVRGASGGEELSVTLADLSGQQLGTDAAPFIAGGGVGVQWREAVIPLSAFEGIHLPSVDKVFFDLAGGPASVLIDFLSFTGAHPDAGAVGLPGAGAVFSLPDGVRIELSGVVVTENFGSFFYVEEPDRAAGLRVQAAGPYVPGDVLQIRAELATLDGERVLISPSITKAGRADVPAPLNISPAAIGTALPENTGLRVRTWGTAGESSGDEFLLHTASGRTLPVIAQYLPRPSPGTFVIVTAVAGARQSGEGVESVLRVRLASDIEVETEAAP